MKWLVIVTYVIYQIRGYHLGHQCAQAGKVAKLDGLPSETFIAASATTAFPLIHKSWESWVSNCICGESDFKVSEVAYCSSPLH